MNKSTKLEILNKAALRIHQGDSLGICSAIAEANYAVCGSLYAEIRLDFRDLFFVEGRTTYFMSYDEGTYFSKLLSTQEAKERRLTAIAFLIAMVEAGDL